jgi:hypothetical protein
MNQSASVRYELWKERDGYSFFPESNDSARQVPLPGAELVWSCDACSYAEAEARKQEYLGFESYRP